MKGVAGDGEERARRHRRKEGSISGTQNKRIIIIIINKCEECDRNELDSVRFTEVWSLEKKIEICFSFLFMFIIMLGIGHFF